jgi:hypothetical protein
MPFAHTTPARTRSASATPRAPVANLLERWPDTIAVAVLLAIVAMTIRAAHSQPDPAGTAATIAVVVLLSGAVVRDLDDRAHGDRGARRSDK